jgi:hypothetical protein
MAATTRVASNGRSTTCDDGGPEDHWNRLRRDQGDRTDVSTAKPRKEVGMAVVEDDDH